VGRRGGGDEKKAQRRKRVRWELRNQRGENL